MATRQSINAHRVVLAAGSSYFRQVSFHPLKLENPNDFICVGVEQSFPVAAAIDHTDTVDRVPEGC